MTAHFFTRIRFCRLCGPGRLHDDPNGKRESERGHDADGESQVVGIVTFNLQVSYVKTEMVERTK